MGAWQGDLCAIHAPQHTQISGNCSCSWSQGPLCSRHFLEYSRVCWNEESRIEWMHDKQNFKTKSLSSSKITKNFQSHIFQLHHYTPHTWLNGLKLCCCSSCCWCDQSFAALHTKKSYNLMRKKPPQRFVCLQLTHMVYNLFICFCEIIRSTCLGEQPNPTYCKNKVYF